MWLQVVEDVYVIFVLNGGNVVRYPTLIAFVSVLRVGEKSDMWAKTIRAAKVGASITELNVCMCSCGVSIIHDLVTPGDPCIIILSLCTIYNFPFVKHEVQHASHNCYIDNRDPDANYRHI